jgi:hypothetical protein
MIETRFIEPSLSLAFTSATSSFGWPRSARHLAAAQSVMSRRSSEARIAGASAWFGALRLSLPARGTAAVWTSAGSCALPLQLPELDHVTGSKAASTALAENYVGLPPG